MAVPSSGPSPGPSGRRRPPGRYDPPSLVGQRVLALLLAVLAVAFVAAGASFVWSRYSGEQVRGEVRTWDVRSDTAVSMEVQVVKSAGSKAYCVLRSRGRTGVEVGRDVAVVDAVGTSERVARASFVLATTERAVTAEIAGCSARPIARDQRRAGPAGAPGRAPGGGAEP